MAFANKSNKYMKEICYLRASRVCVRDSVPLRIDIEASKVCITK